MSFWACMNSIFHARQFFINSGHILDIFRANKIDWFFTPFNPYFTARLTSESYNGPLKVLPEGSNVQKVKHLSPFLERGTFLRNGTGTLYIFSHLESKVKERPFSKLFFPFQPPHHKHRFKRKKTIEIWKVSCQIDTKLANQAMVVKRTWCYLLSTWPLCRDNVENIILKHNISHEH